MIGLSAMNSALYERLCLKASRTLLVLSHSLLRTAARSYWHGMVGRQGLRRALWISSRLDRAGVRLMRRSLHNRRADKGG